MTEQQAENLRTLIRHMESNVTRMLDMGKVHNACGTPACAIGEAAYAGIAGLRIPRADATECCVMLDGRTTFYRDAALDVFGNTSLFAPRLSDVSPQEWAAEARAVLAENGYSMVPRVSVPVETAFDKFMAKVKEPVAVE